MGTVRQVDRDQFVWALGAMCRAQRVPFNADQALKRNPPPYFFDQIPRVAGALGLTARVSHLDDVDLTARVPCLVALKPDDVDTAQVGLLTRAEGDTLDLLQPDGTGTLSRSAFERRFDGVAVHFSRSERADSAASEVPKFGFGWFVPQLLKYKAQWGEVLFASLVIQTLGVITPLLTQVIIDRVVAHQATNTLVAISIALALIVVFTATMTWARQYVMLHAGSRVDAVLGNQVFERLLSLPARYFESRPTGTLVARLQGVQTIRDFMTGAAVTVFLDVPFLLVFLAAMLYYSVHLTLVVVALLALVVLLSLAVAPIIRARVNREFLAGARNQAFLTEYIAGMDTVKSLQMEPQLKSRYAAHLSELLSAGFSTRKLHNGYSVAVQSLEQLVVLAVLCLGAWEVMRNDGFTVGMLVAFQMFALRLAQPLSRIAGLWQEFQQASIAVQRLGDLMDVPGEPQSSSLQRVPRANAEIEVEDLHFRHSERAPELFHGLDFRVRPGQCVAITGASGSGKSTLARLLQSIYPPSSGRIRVGGCDIRSLAVDELRALLGVVPQETRLFSGTIYDNLTSGSPNAEFQDVVQACRFAEVHETVEALPEGYQTRIGEHGTGLSGGQRQRLAIARALLRKPAILIFDEATSQLDAVTAMALHATVNRLKGRLSIIVIAHEVPRGLEIDAHVTVGAKEGGRGKH